MVQGHTEEEVRSILIAFEDISRSQFPALQLGRWTKSIFTWLTHATLDPDGSKRVTMDHLARLVTSTLRQSYEQGATDVTPQALQARAELMTLRRDEIIAIESLPAPLPISVQQVREGTTFLFLIRPGAPRFRIWLPHCQTNGSLLSCCAVMKGISGEAEPLSGMSDAQQVRDPP